MTETLKERIQQDMKTAMRQKDTERLGTIRLILAAIKQREVDERIELNDSQVIEALGKMVKQRRDALDQYEKAGRQDLADKESFELSVIDTYLPPALADDELQAMIDAAVSESGAESVRDMGKVMALLKPRIQGRADLGQVSAQVKARLG